MDINTQMIVLKKIEKKEWWEEYGVKWEMKLFELKNFQGCIHPFEYIELT